MGSDLAAACVELVELSRVPTVSLVAGHDVRGTCHGRCERVASISAAPRALTHSEDHAHRTRAPVPAAVPARALAGRWLPVRRHHGQPLPARAECRHHRQRRRDRRHGLHHARSARSCSASRWSRSPARSSRSTSARGLRWRWDATCGRGLRQGRDVRGARGRPVRRPDADHSLDQRRPAGPDAGVHDVHAS